MKDDVPAVDITVAVKLFYRFIVADVYHPGFSPMKLERETCM